jgi:hypothetical protein
VVIAAVAASGMGWAGRGLAADQAPAVTTPGSRPL